VALLALLDARPTSANGRENIAILLLKSNSTLTNLEDLSGCCADSFLRFVYLFNLDAMCYTRREQYHNRAGFVRHVRGCDTVLVLFARNGKLGFRTGPKAPCTAGVDARLDQSVSN
jgi:hypothetical protein